MSDEPNSTELRQRRRDEAANWLDNLLPPSIQRLVVTTVVLAVMGRMGFNVSENGAVAQRAVAGVEEIRQALRDELTASRTNWSRGGMTQQLARIEATVNRIEARP